VAKNSLFISQGSLINDPKKAIIIGASSGIGAALVEKLVSEGYWVAALARREDLLKKLCAQVNATGTGYAAAYPHDVAQSDAIPELFQQLFTDLGGLDSIIYVAGSQPSLELDEFDWQKDQQMIQVNLAGAIAWLGQAATLFAAQANGQIVGISSLAGDRGRVRNPGYSSTKAGLDAYLEALRNRLSKIGVNVLTVKPGFVDTVLLANAPTTFGVISPAQAAQGIFSAMRKRQQLIYIPWWWRWLMRVIRFIPSFVFRRLTV
jgi:short-subunit dehydrogenase